MNMETVCVSETHQSLAEQSVRFKLSTLYDLNSILCQISWPFIHMCLYLSLCNITLCERQLLPFVLIIAALFREGTCMANFSATFQPTEIFDHINWFYYIIKQLQMRWSPLCRDMTALFASIHNITFVKARNTIITYVKYGAICKNVWIYELTKTKAQHRNTSHYITKRNDFMNGQIKTRNVKPIFPNATWIYEAHGWPELSDGREQIKK